MGTDLAFMMQTALGRGTPAKQSTASEAEPSAEDERERRVEGPTRSEVKRSEGERPDYYFYY